MARLRARHRPSRTRAVALRVRPKPKPKPKALPPITQLRSSKDLLGLATQQTDAEIGGAVQPYQSELDTTQGRESRAMEEMGKMFGGLQQHAADSARAVQGYYDQGRAAEESIFRAAGQRLNNLKQSSAAEAQDLAQKIGGPVAIGDFTGAIDPASASFEAEKGGSLLHALGMAQAGTQEAQAWSGRVFPLIQTEKTAKTRQYFNDQIKELEDHISQLKSTRGSSINSKYNELLTSERQYQLQQAQERLAELKTHQDWQATQHTLRNDDARLGIAGAQFGLQQAGVTGTYKGKPTLAAQKLTADQRIAAQRMNLSAQQFAARLATTEEGLQIQRQRAANQAQKNAMQMIDSMLNPSSNKPITLTKKLYVPKGSPEENQINLSFGKRKDAHWDKHKKQWYTYQRITSTAAEWASKNTGGTPITDPKQMYKFLLNAGIPKKRARELIKARTGKDPVGG